MISDEAVIELMDIISSDYGKKVSLEKVRKIGEGLVNIYSLILESKALKGIYEAKRV